MQPIDQQQSADPLLVAASAARPPVSTRRGRRSHTAHSRRLCEWLKRQAATSTPTLVHISDRSGLDNSCSDASPSIVSPPPSDDSCPGKPGHVPSFNCYSSLGFTVLHLNIRSVNSGEKRAMLSAHLERFDPDIFALNETWLEESVARADIPNYQLVSRRDRPTSKVGK